MTLDLDASTTASLPPEALRPEPTTPRSFVRFRGAESVWVREPVITEVRLAIVVDGRELVSLMCSPHQLRALVLGFLYAEGFLDSLEDVELLRICLEDRVAEVILRDRPFEPLPRKILTSGCTGGATFGRYLAELDRFRVAGGATVVPRAVYEAMNQLYRAAGLYHRSRGVHTSILSREGEVLAVGEDIGRHNTLDKIQGECLLRGTPTAGGQLFTSGRISSEMLLKAAIMGVGIVGSRTSPTELALTLAERLNVTVIGYIRPDGMNIYTHPWRVARGG